MPPGLHSLLAPPIIYIVRTTLGVNHMGHQRLNIVRRTMFHANNVTITHQRNMLTVDANDAVYHIAGPARCRLPAHEGASLG